MARAGAFWVKGGDTYHGRGGHRFLLSFSSGDARMIAETHVLYVARHLSLLKREKFL